MDFLGPVDLGLWNFPIFNVADIAITCGAILLAVSFWLEEQQERTAAAEAEAKAAELEAGAVDAPVVEETDTPVTVDGDAPEAGRVEVTGAPGVSEKPGA